MRRAQPGVDEEVGSHRPWPRGMPLWRWFLYLWMDWSRYPDYRAYGIPPERIVTVEVPIEVE